MARRNYVFHLAIMPELRVLPRVCRLLGICLRLATEWLPQAKEVVAVMWRKDEIEAMVFQRHRSLFGDAGEAAAFVAEVVTRYAK